MTRLARNRIVLATVGAWLLYWPVALLVPQSIMIEIINGMVAALSIGLVVAYAPGAWYRLRKTPYHMSGADMLVLGITVLQIALAGLYIWAWAYRYLNAPMWMAEHAVRGWLVYLLFLGSVLLLLASEVGVTSEVVPERGWVRTGVIVALGIALGITLLALGH